MIDALIFSRNRPLQLDALISSIKKFSNMDGKKINVLHRYDEKYTPGLERVKKIHDEVNFIDEKNFELQVKDYLKLGEKFCVFFVDDMLLKNDVDFNLPCSVLSSHPQFLTFSLRLGTHLTHCYPVNSRQIVPNGTVNSQLFLWEWRGTHHDWGYPFSVDGHIFRRSELEGWSSHLLFKNPNQFESELQSIPRTFAIPPGMCCYLNSKIFNNPLNRVQDEFKNRAEGESIDELYDAWMSGLSIDIDKFYGFINDAAHHPLPLPMKDSK